MTPVLWLIFGGGSALWLVATYGFVSSICTRAGVTPDALVLRTLFGREVRLRWTEIRPPIQLWESRPFWRLEIVFKASFFSVRSAYQLRLASLNDPESLMSAIREHLPVEAVLTTPDLFRPRPELKKPFVILAWIVAAAVVALFAITTFLD